MRQLWSKIVLCRIRLVGFLVVGILLLVTGSAGGQEGPPAEANPSSSILQSLTETERAWLRDHPVIRVAQDPSWAPIEFVDERGTPSGMTADYLRLIEGRLGVKFLQEKNLSWQEAYTRLKTWEIDMTTSVAMTSEREMFWTFTKPYMIIPIVIITRSDVTYVADLRELEGKKVAVVSGYVSETWIARDYPKIQLVRVQTVEEALAILKRGEVLACVENMMVADYIITTLKMSGLKISGSTPYVNTQSMAVRKDWALLAGILDKALDSISETERSEIHRRWLPELYKDDFDYRILWWALGIFVVILLVSAAYIWQLHREIAHRKRAEADAEKSARRFQQFFSFAPMPLALSDREGTLTLVNDLWKQTFGYTLDEIPTIKDWWRLAYPDPAYRHRVIDTWDAAVRRTRETDTDLIESQDYLVTCKNGEVRSLEVSGIFIDDELLVAFYDITERKKAENRLAESESLLSRAQELAHLGSWNLNLTTNKLYWSDETYRIFGCEPQLFTATYEAFLEFIHPDDRAAVEEAYSRSMREKSDGYVIEHRILRQSTGEVRYVYERCVHVHDNAGDIIQSIGMVQDITERKAAETGQRKLLEQVERDRRALVSTLEDQRRTEESLKQRLHQSVNAISKIGEIRDVYTSGHQKRVAELACAIGSEMGLTDERINALSIGGLIHDIGQIFIPSDILNKPGKITDLEYRIIQTHAEKSYNVVKQIDFPAEIPTMIYQHHERLDGTGYPRKLSGDEIILESRILAVADVVEAMCSHRSYRPALGIDAALEEILRYQGTKYDAEVVDMCTKLFKEKGFAFQSLQKQ